MMTTVGAKVIEVIDSPRDVLALLREQASLYANLEALAARQQSLVTAEGAGPLLALLADRQKISDRLTHVAGLLERVRKGWAAYRLQLSSAQRSEADGLWDDVKQRLRRIIDSDERDARVLSVRKEAAAKALRATHSTGEALTAYRAPTGRATRLDFMDEGVR